MKNLIIIILLTGWVLSCSKSPNKYETQEVIDIRGKVDQVVASLDIAVSKYDLVLRIDHSRLAEEEEVYTPPSVVTIFSNPSVNSNLLKKNQLIGIDLPYKVLCYSEPDLNDAHVSYTSPEFIAQRHALSRTDLADFSADINKVISAFPKSAIASNDLGRLDQGFGIIIEKSDFDYVTTIDKLKRDILAQGDTQIFAEIDFQKEAAENSVEIDPTILILFGAPAPGGKAMNKTPRIGLDAFCQKLLIFQKGNEVFIAFNNIVEFSELYYQKSTIPQRVVNRRLASVFKRAITKE